MDTRSIPESYVFVGDVSILPFETGFNDLDRLTASLSLKTPAAVLTRFARASIQQFPGPVQVWDSRRTEPVEPVFQTLEIARGRTRPFFPDIGN